MNEFILWGKPSLWERLQNSNLNALKKGETQKGAAKQTGLKWLGSEGKEKRPDVGPAAHTPFLLEVFAVPLATGQHL